MIIVLKELFLCEKQTDYKERKITIQPPPFFFLCILEKIVSLLKAYIFLSW